jgi:dienelactone hydrolase
LRKSHGSVPFLADLRGDISVLRRLVLCLVAGSAIGASTALAQTAATPVAIANDPPPDPRLNEEIVRIPLTLPLARGGMHRGAFVLTTFRPSGAGPFPAVIVSHGRDPQKRAIFGRSRMMWAFWLRRGFAVLAPTRIGYGVSGADVDPEAAKGACDIKNYGPMASAVTAHIRATLDYAATQPWIDKSNLVLVGASVGGFGSIVAAGGHLPGVKAVVNFAGGTGGWIEKRPEHPCSAGSVELQIVSAARRGALPGIWFYSENDRLWGPQIPRHWHAAYVKAGGTAEFHMLPPLGENGHNVIGLGFEHWRPPLDRFLRSVGFAPRKLPPDAPPATGFAALDDPPTVSRISQRCREIYAEFLKKDVARAFAIAPSGTCAYYASQLDVVAKSLARCKEIAKQDCKLYAVNDDVVWQPDAAASR